MLSQSRIPAYATLAELLSAVTPLRDYGPLGATLLPAEQLPAGARHLLVHERHMTERLRAHYRADPRLEVLSERAAPGEGGEDYSREILLHASTATTPIEFGIVRIHSRWLAAETMAEIRRRARPLGDILVAHDVLRRIEPRWYFRFDADSRPGKALQVREPAFGRVGVIHCNGAPAIELLEVVPG